MDPEQIPDYLKILGKNIEKRFDAMKEENDKKKKDEAQPSNQYAGPIRMNSNGMTEFEPDWEELDKRADRIVAGYAAMAAAGNILPLPLDVMVVTGIFAKMTTELAGVYQVIVSTKRARQIGWAISTTTGSILGATYAASSLVKFIPFGYAVSVAVQAPIVGGICWAAGDALKKYFKASRQGIEPDINSLRDSFARTLRMHLATVKTQAEKATGVKTPATPPAETVTVTPAAVTVTTSTAAPVEQVSVSDALDKIATLHELMRVGAITKDEFEKKKAELLSRI